MLIDPEEGKIHLQKGESIPVFCDCGAIYQPTLGTQFSVCENCGAENQHEDMPGAGLVASFLEMVPWAMMGLGIAGGLWIAGRYFLGWEY